MPDVIVFYHEELVSEKRDVFVIAPQQTAGLLVRRFLTAAQTVRVALPADESYSGMKPSRDGQKIRTSGSLLQIAPSTSKYPARDSCRPSESSA